MAADIVSVLAGIVGEQHVLTGAAVRERTTAWRTHEPCRARALVMPRSTGQVAAVLRACNEAAQPVVPFGGITNLVQACATDENDVALSLERMDTIEETDATAHTMTVQAGVTMRRAQDAAEAAGLFFPVDIGARDNCMLGGNVATNAGGTKVIRYGMIRDSVLGLEAVLADGTVVSSMNRYIKNNSGFDLKHLFIGTEGLLGVITRIVFRLTVRPKTHNVALVACERFDQVVEVLNAAKSMLGSKLCGFEVMWDDFYRKATQPEGRLRSPFDTRYPLYAIVESMGNSEVRDDEEFEQMLGKLIEDGLVIDGVMGKSGQERSALWAIRGEVEWLVSDAYNFDVSLRSADVGRYVDDVTARISADIDDAYVAAFGHLGDNNIHISVLTGGDDHATVEGHIYEALRPFSGAISAEHGIGLEKRAWLPISRTPEEINLMRSLKTMMDPNNILNPGKVLGIE